MPDRIVRISERVGDDGRASTVIGINAGTNIEDRPGIMKWLAELLHGDGENYQISATAPQPDIGELFFHGHIITPELLPEHREQFIARCVGEIGIGLHGGPANKERPNTMVLERIIRDGQPTFQLAALG